MGARGGLRMEVVEAALTENQGWVGVMDMVMVTMMVSWVEPGQACAASPVWRRLAMGR